MVILIFLALCQYQLTNYFYAQHLSLRFNQKCITTNNLKKFHF